MSDEKTEFEYGGVWMHFTDRVAHNWRQKGPLLNPSVDDFHRQLVILRHVGLEKLMSEAYHEFAFYWS